LKNSIFFRKLFKPHVMFRGVESTLSPATCEFWQLNRIPYSPLPAGTRYARWLSSDSEENYKRRGNREFSPESVNYNFNSYGYRSDEFDVDRSPPAIVFIGCSNTLGIGIPFEALWTTIVTRYFQEQWKTTVLQYNLAWMGTGSDHVAMMVHQCIDLLKPAAVFVLWSYVNRMTWFADVKRRFHFLPDSTRYAPPKEHEAFLLLSTDAQAFFNYVRNYNFVYDRLFRRNIPFFCGNLEQFSIDTLRNYVPTDCFVGRWNRLDAARDNQHSGVKSHADFAVRTIAAAKGVSLEQ
jgi:hypothetical protein